MSDIGDRLKKARKEANITQRELSELSGISQATISFIESGRNDPGYESLTALASALNLSVSSFIGEEQPIKVEPLTFYPPERPLLLLYRALNDNGQQVAMDMLRSLAMNPAFQRDNKKTAVPAV